MGSYTSMEGVEWLSTIFQKLFSPSWCLSFDNKTVPLGFCYYTVSCLYVNYGGSALNLPIWFFFWEKLVRYSLIQSSSLVTGILQVFQLDMSAMGAKVEFWRTGHRLEPNEVWRSVIRTKHLPEWLKAITFNRNSIHDIHVSLSILGLEVSLANLEEHSLGYSSGLYHTWVGRADDLPSPASFSQMTVVFSWKIYNRKCQPICIIEMKEALRMNKKLGEAVSYMVKKKLKAEQLKKLKALKSIFKRFI